VLNEREIGPVWGSCFGQSDGGFHEE